MFSISTENWELCTAFSIKLRTALLIELKIGHSQMSGTKELQATSYEFVSSIQYKGKKDLKDFTTELLREITELHRELDRMLRTTIYQF